MMLPAWTPSLQSLPAIHARILYRNGDVRIVNKKWRRPSPACAASLGR